MKKIAVPIFLLLSYIALVSYAYKTDDKKIKPSEIELKKYPPIIVLELFTSQGCSSCPAADVLLEKVKNEYKKEVFALSYHVDYWNYIGWKDPYSKAHYAKKQKLYNNKFKYRGNYTPELVVNGKEHLVGSHKNKVYDIIAKYESKLSSNNLHIENVTSNREKIEFTYAIEGLTENKKVKAVLVLDKRITKVNKGENKNRTLNNSNIVIAEKYIAIQSKKGKGSIRIPSLVKQNEKIQLMLFVETDNYDITAAAKKPITQN